jgi:hypothetical protein
MMAHTVIVLDTIRQEQLGALLASLPPVYI